MFVYSLLSIVTIQSSLIWLFFVFVMNACICVSVHLVCWLFLSVCDWLPFYFNFLFFILCGTVEQSAIQEATNNIRVLFLFVFFFFFFFVRFRQASKLVLMQFVNNVVKILQYEWQYQNFGGLAKTSVIWPMCKLLWLWSKWCKIIISICDCFLLFHVILFWVQKVFSKNY